ncbi:MAG: thioesterase [Eubacterium sp.]|nr:thioesterase [Eubacterium sp.]
MSYTFDARVRFSEVDHNGRLTLPAIEDYLQDTATFHGEEVGHGVRENTADGVGWIVASLQAKVYDYPEIGDHIKVRTWAAKFSSLLGLREFDIRDAEGRTLLLAKSEWLLMDLAEHKPVKIPDVQLEAYGLDSDLVIKENLGKRKIVLPKDGGEAGRPISVGEYMIDTNGHVNNGQYVRLSLALLPRDIKVKDFRLNFKKQAYLGDILHPVIHRLENGWMVALNDAEGEPFFLGEYTA